MALNILSIIVSFLCAFSVSKAATLWSRDGQPFSSQYVYTPGFYPGFQINSTDYISKVADDIIIPSGENWSIENIYCGGGVSQAGTLSRIGNWTVQIVLNDGIRPSDDVVVSRVFPQTTTASPTFTFDPPVLLEGGGITYWVIVIPNFNFNTDPDDYYWVWLSLNGPVLGSAGQVIENPRFLFPPSQEPNTWYSTVYDHIFTVNGIRVDTQPPTCVNMFAGPPEIDLNTRASQALNFTLLVDDNLGFDYGALTVSGPNGTIYNVRFDSTNRRTGTTATNGIYTIEDFILDRSHPGGSYQLTSLKLFDVGGNSLNLTTTGMINQCFLSTASINVIAYIAPASSSTSAERDHALDDEPNKPIPLLAIILPIIITIVIVIMIGVLFLFYRRQRTNLPPKDTIEIKTLKEKTHTKEAAVQQRPLKEKKHTKDKKVQQRSFKEMKYIKEITVQQRLGGGNFGDVYQGTWNQTTPVALKKLKAEDSLSFEREWNVLQTLQHPNVVRLFGVYMDKHTKDKYLVMELLPMGSLLSLIQSQKEPLSIKDKIFIAKEAASGMQYLASNNIVHADFAVRNLLVTKVASSSNKLEYSVKVCDFGLSKILESNSYYGSEQSAIPVRWSAPEVIKYRKFSLASDVWSFGIAMWELFSGGQLPYFEIVNNNDVTVKVVEGHLLNQPSECPDDVYAVMLYCWTVNVAQRPNMSDIYSLLNEIYHKYNRQPTQARQISSNNLDSNYMA